MAQRRRFALLKQTTGLDSLGDVNITGATAGQLLEFDGSVWTNVDFGDLSDFAEAVDDRVAALMTAGNNIDVTYDDALNTFTISVEALTSADIGDFAEAVDDRVGSLLVAGTNVTLTYNDGANTLTIDAAGGGDVSTDALWDAAGDLVVGSGANTAARLAVGAEGEVLTVVSGVPAWAAATGGGGGGSGGVGVGHPDAPPVTPDALDDEFDDATLDAKWVRDTNFSTGSAPTITLSGGALLLKPSSAATIDCYGQAVSGTFKIRAKVALLTSGGMAASYTNYQQAGIYVSYSTTKRISLHLLSNLQLETGRWNGTSYSSSSSYGIGGSKDEYERGLYLEIEVDATTIYYRASRTGHEGTFVTLGSELISSFLGTTPDQCGLMNNPSSGTNSWMLCDWFRKIGGSYAPGTFMANGTSGGDVATDAIWDATGDLAVGSGADTAARLAVGAEGQVLTVVSGSPAWAASRGNDPAAYAEFFDEFLAHSSSAFYLNANTWRSVVSSSNSHAWQASEAGHPGIMRATNANTASGAYTIYCNTTNQNATGSNIWYIDGSNELVYETMIRVSALPSSADNISYRIGLQNLNNATHYLTFILQWNGSAVEWYISNAAGASGTATVNTADLPTADTWVKLRIVATSTEVTYYIDDVLVATHTATIPTDVMTPYYTTLRGAAGTTSRTMDIDYCLVRQSFPSGRPA